MTWYVGAIGAVYYNGEYYQPGQALPPSFEKDGWSEFMVEVGAVTNQVAAGLTEEPQSQLPPHVVESEVTERPRIQQAGDADPLQQVDPTGGVGEG